MEEWEKGNEATNKNQKELTWELCSSHLDLALSPLKQKHTPLLSCLLLVLLLLTGLYTKFKNPSGIVLI